MKKQNKIATMGKNFFFFFCKSILGYNKLNEDNMKWCVKIQAYVEQWEQSRAAGIEKQFNSIWLEPRETYKTTVLNVCLCIWLIIRNPNISIIIGSKIAGNAIKFLHEIKRHFESNAILKGLYGDYKGDIWSSHMIIVSKRTELGIKEPTIQAIGTGSSVTSVHYVVGIFDDLVDGSDRVSPAERESTSNLNKDLVDIIKRDGFKMYIGTRWHPNDLYYEIIHNIIPNSKYNKWVEDIQSCWNEDGTARFKVLPKELLEQKKTEKGSVVFAANYENKPLAAETQLFAEETCHYFDMKDLNLEGAEIVGFCDPAVGRTKKACFAPVGSAVVIREDESGNMLQHPELWVFDYDVQRRTTSKLKNVIAQKHKQFNYFRFGMESNAFQSELADNTEELITSFEDVDNLIIEHVNTSINKNVKIESLEMPINLGYIRFRSDWRTAENNYKEGMEQLFWYPIHDYLDGPDMLAMLYELANKTAGVLV